MTGLEAIMAAEFLAWVRSDFQLDRASPNYLGFVNLSNTDFLEPRLLVGFAVFVHNYREFSGLLRNLGLELESMPSLEETIFELVEK